jgi:hypothetical protein
MTLTFKLTRRESATSPYTIDSYQLTDIEPNLSSTSITSRVNNSH